VLDDIYPDAGGVEEPKTALAEGLVSERERDRRALTYEPLIFTTIG
jgi:hypothetical protein